MFCKNCGKEISDEALACPACGQPYLQPKLKNKVVFVLLALFLGGLGIHRMYLGNWLLGILYLLFCWTYVPAVIALFEAIIIGLRKNDPRFEP